MSADSEETLMMKKNKLATYWKESPAYVLFKVTPIFITMLAVAAGISMVFASPLQCGSSNANGSIFSEVDNFCITQICKENKSDSWVDSDIKFLLDSPCTSTCVFIPLFLILVALLFTICMVFFDRFYHKDSFPSDNMDNEEGVVHFFHDEETDDVIRITETHGNCRRKVNKFVITRALVEFACFLTIVAHIIVVNEMFDGHFVSSGFTIWNSFSVRGESLGKVFKTRINCKLDDYGMMKIGPDELEYSKIGDDDLDNNLACASPKNKVKIILFLILWMWFFAQILVLGFRLFFAIRFMIYRCIGKGSNIYPIQLV